MCKCALVLQGKKLLAKTCAEFKLTRTIYMLLLRDSIGISQNKYRENHFGVILGGVHIKSSKD